MLNLGNIFLGLIFFLLFLFFYLLNSWLISFWCFFFNWVLVVVVFFLFIWSWVCCFLIFVRCFGVGGFVLVVLVGGLGLFVLLLLVGVFELLLFFFWLFEIVVLGEDVVIVLRWGVVFRWERILFFMVCIKFFCVVFVVVKFGFGNWFRLISWLVLVCVRVLLSWLS